MKSGANTILDHVLDVGMAPNRVTATVHYASHKDELRGLEDFKGGVNESGLDLL